MPISESMGTCSTRQSERAMSPFVIYLETNWLVSYVIPHHPWRSEARSLLEAADRGECSLRIPKVAFLEAWHVVDRETRSHTDAVKSVAGSLSDAARGYQATTLGSALRCATNGGETGWRKT